MKKFYDEEFVQNVKQVSIVLSVVAVLMFLTLSTTVFKYSQRHPVQYQVRLSQMSTSGQVILGSMHKVGEVEINMLTRSRSSKMANSTFLEEVAKNHKK